MIPGSCLCGEIRYEVDSSASELGHCHCRMCQKFHGASHATYLEVPREHFRLLTGKALLASFRSSAKVTRCFCRRCGSPLLFDEAGKKTIDVVAATLDAVTDARLSYEIWTSAWVPWVQEDGPLDSYPTEPER